MSGLDMIVDEIIKSAQEEAAGIISESDDYCAQLLAKAEKESAAEVAAIEKESVKAENLLEQKSVSGAKFKERNAILAAKVGCIDEAVEAAKADIRAMDDSQYFSLLLKILKNNVQSGTGVMRLSETDLKRMPKSFIVKVNAIALEAKGLLTIDKEPADIKDGFVLVYGEIEENCTIDTLIETNIDAIRDEAAGVLFS